MAEPARSWGLRGACQGLKLGQVREAAEGRAEEDMRHGHLWTGEAWCTRSCTLQVYALQSSD